MNRLYLRFQESYGFDFETCSMLCDYTIQSHSTLRSIVVLLAERNGVLEIQIHCFVELLKCYKIKLIVFRFCWNGYLL